jgi:uncharacterized protein YjiS (DUF1127 family)
MAAISVHHTPHNPLAGTFGAIGRAVATWRGRARMRNELSKLDHRMMRDLALNPSDIEFEISKPFWRA